MTASLHDRSNGLGRIRRCRLVAGSIWRVALLIPLCAGCQSSNRVSDGAGASGLAPRFDGMGHHRRPVETRDTKARQYFDQGLVWAYAFNHDEAIRSFTEAARIDPEFAMAWWGIALCHGPHINNPVVPEDRAAAAWAALQKALVHKDKASPVNRALIEALTKRYADPQPEDRSPLDKAYAEAMTKVYAQYPEDTDVGTLYAEALMDLHPWDLWTQEKRPKGDALKILAVLEGVLEREPDHPGANHLYIHAVEPSAEPANAMASANRLCDLVPASGHLVHMPSHIYVLTGHWEKASEQNVKAIEADRAYRKRSPRQGFYRVYMTHNHHMLAFACMMEGRYKDALRAARELVADVPEDYKREQSAYIDPYLMVVTDVLTRFGKWEAVLAEPEPPTYLPITTAFWRFSRGVAYANLEQFDKADDERAKFREAVEKVPADALMAINRARDVLTIAGYVLDGEIAYRRGHLDGAVSDLRQAVVLEDQLLYMEPPEWILPVRHPLGAILLEAGKVDEAEEVYRADLKDWPENGWSLYGLAECLDRKKSDEAREVTQRFQKAWARSDTKIHASCLCAR